MLCPLCQIKMTAFFADNLELDRCPKCEGLWLDLGEVERLHGLKGLSISQLDVDATCPRGHGEENKIRGRETSLGGWIADRMLAAFAPCGAQVAFLNAGTLRLNQDLAAGSTLTRRQVEELFGFPSPLHLIRMNGKLLLQTAKQSVRGWPGSGTWLQIAGWAFVHDSGGKAATGLVRLAPSGALPVDPDEEILAVTGDYLVNPGGDQDGYTFLPTEEVPGCPASGKDLKELVIEALRAAEPEGIAPRTEGRICQGAEGPCLAGR